MTNPFVGGNAPDSGRLFPGVTRSVEIPLTTAGDLRINSAVTVFYCAVINDRCGTTCVGGSGGGGGEWVGSGGGPAISASETHRRVANFLFTPTPPPCLKAGRHTHTGSVCNPAIQHCAAPLTTIDGLWGTEKERPYSLAPYNKIQSINYKNSKRGKIQRWRRKASRKQSSFQRARSCRAKQRLRR